MSVALRLFVLLLCVSLTACATRAPRPRPAAGGAGHAIAWPLAALASVDQPRLLLSPGQDGIWLATPPLQAAWSAAGNLLAGRPHPHPQIVLLAEPTANAFAMRHGEAALVAITLGMVDALGDDEAAWAALFGHEFAHLDLRHSEVRQQRQQTGEGLSAAMGLALTLAGVPFGPVFADATSAVVERGYSRDDERAADQAGIAAMARAGYDPAGAVRLFEKLDGSGPLFAFLSTHPAGAERLDAARAAAAARPGAPRGSAVPR